MGKRRGMSRRERNEALLQERERIGESAVVPVATRVWFLVFAFICLSLFCAYGTFAASKYNRGWMGLGTSIAVALAMYTLSGAAVWFQRRDGAMIAAMMYGLLFVMAGICSFLATWGIIIFAIFIVEGTTSIYYFLLWSLLNGVTGTAVYLLLPSIATLVLLANTGVYLAFMAKFFQWSDMCVFCEMTYVALGMWTVWMLLATTVIFISYSRHAPLSRFACIFLWGLSGASLIFVEFSWYVYDGVFSYVAFKQPPYITRQYAIGPPFLLSVSLLGAGAVSAYFTARQAYRVYLIKSGRSEDLLKLQLLGADGEANPHDEDEAFELHTDAQSGKGSSLDQHDAEIDQAHYDDV